MLIDSISLLSICDGYKVIHAFVYAKALRKSSEKRTITPKLIGENLTYNNFIFRRDRVE
jgi:hypothetical protein